MTKQQLSPIVMWAQTETHITLKVELSDVKSPNIELRDKEITFAGLGNGAGGANNYHFHLDFYLDIDTEASTYKVLDSKVIFTLRKASRMWWTRLTSQPQKPHWLKIDFERWRTEANDEHAEDEEQPRNVINDYPGMYERLEKEETGYRKEKTRNVYLVCYNLCQFIGYLYILLVMCIRYQRDGSDSLPGTYANVGNAMKFCQLLQYLEVMHPFFGYTKGSALMPFIQVTGRNFVLFIMIEAEERMQTKPVIMYLFFVWSLVEVIRYPYYISLLLKQPFHLLTWLRYTIWIPLYPLGVLFEGIVILRNIPYFEVTNQFSVDMPNAWNFAFSMTMFMKIYLIVLILPGTYYMMSYMRKARKQKLGPKSWNRKRN